MQDAPQRQVISDQYRLLQQDLHRIPNYGVASLQFAPFVKQVIEQMGA